MPIQGLVNETDIAALGVDGFRRVVNKLLTVESSIYALPLEDLDLTLREYDPDGGVDARVKWPTHVSHHALRAGENVLQYKTGKVDHSTLKEEFYKPGVQRALRNGGHYLLLISKDLNSEAVKDARAYLGGLCEQESIPEELCHVLAASQIARWICWHPAVITTPELGKGIPGFSTVAEWNQLPAMRNPWRADAERADVEGRVRALLQKPDLEDPVIRIEGPAGVGKTRLALHCISSAGLAERVIYSPNADSPQAQALLAAVQSDPRAYAIVVADECDRDRQNLFRSFAELSGGRLRLLCVGPGDVLFQSPAEFAHVFVIFPMSETTMRDILGAEAGIVPSEITDVAIRLSGGYPKLAFFIATALRKQTVSTPEELRKITSIRDLLKKFFPENTVKALRAVSLLDRLGWEGDLQVEAKSVSSYLDIRFEDLQEGVKVLRDQGVVMTRGRYLYVTPDLLAIDAAAQLWDIRGPDLIGIVTTLPTVGPRRELLKRLAAMGRHPQVQSVVERLLGEDGLYSSLEDLDDEFRSEAFRILASALPDAALRALRRIVEPASRDELLDFRNGRRNVIGAIGTLLRWPTTSLEAARSLRSLALAETESFSNNATGLFAEYFQVHLSGSPLPLEKRLILVDELVASGDESRRLLAVRALGAALSGHETRMGGNIDHLSKRPYPSEWKPTTWSDLWDARRAALARLREIATGTATSASEAQRALLAATFTLKNEGMFDDVIEVLKHLPTDTDNARRKILDESLRLAKDAKDQLSDLQRKELSQLQAGLFDNSYSAKLRRWVGRRLHADYEFEDQAGYSKADDISIGLADETFTNDIQDQDLRWLASSEADNVWQFGLRLGEIDSEMRFFNRIVSFSSEGVNNLFLASYLNGQAKSKGESVREQLLDQLSVDRPLMAFGCTWRGQASRRGFERIVELIDERRVAPEMIAVLVHGGWTKGLATNDVATLVRLMRRGDKDQTREPAMALLQEVVERESESSSQLESLVWEILETTPVDVPTMEQWRWGQLATKVAASNPRRMIELFTSQNGSSYMPLSNERQTALQLATQADPVTAWNLIGQAMISGGELASSLLSVLRKWYGELIPGEVLIEWAKANPPDGPGIVARLVAPTPTEPSQRARALIDAFPTNEDVWDALFSNLITGVWSGPHSNKIARDIEVLKRWAETPDPAFQGWVKKRIEAMEERLQQERIREEEWGF